MQDEPQQPNCAAYMINICDRQKHNLAPEPTNQSSNYSGMPPSSKRNTVQLRNLSDTKSVVVRNKLSGC